MSDKDNNAPANPGRRRFLTTAALAAAGGLVACSDKGGLLSSSTTASSSLPNPQDCGIDHVVVLMMENRSFDHYLSWVPGANARPDDVTFEDTDGNAHGLHNLAPMYQSCNLADPDHSYAGGRSQVNDGKMDGFLKTQPVGDQFPIGYYDADALPFFKGCADNWTICDNYFSAMLGPTVPNRIYMAAGQTDRKDSSTDPCSLPTVWDRMQAAGHSVANYYLDVPYESLWGTKYNSISTPFTLEGFAEDVNAGKLANLTFVNNVGNILNAYFGLSRDDHPVADIRDGQAFLNSVYDVLRQGPQWDRTLLVINYDESGGFYDHVNPPFAPVSDAEYKATGNDGRLGCRVPCVLIGPRVRRGHVEHMQFDHNSILNMLAWRFGFEPLGVRGHTSNNIAHALDFSAATDDSAPAFNVPEGPFGGLCAPLPTLFNLAGIEPPIPLPDLPTVPLPLQLQLPPIPGLDVPIQRLLAHHQELEEIRALGRRNGFPI